MLKLILFVFVGLLSSSVLASGGGGGASGGASGASAERSKVVSPDRVYQERENLRQRMIAQVQGANAKIEAAAKPLAFDHTYKGLGALLKKSVTMASNDQKSTVNYKALTKAEIDKVVDEMLKPSEKMVMKQWSQPQRLAYFVNLYNVLTLKVIKDNYKKIKEKNNSIKDIGSLFKSTWDIKWFTLFGKKATLNEVEHGYIRGDKSGFKQSKKEYKDPRIHFAVNCASKGCPALLDKPFTPKMLFAEFTKAHRNFLRDRSRNGVKGGKLHLSKIYKWYKKDFSRGLMGYSSLKDYAAKNAKYLADTPADIKLLQEKKLSISYTDYDWKLNDAL